jgi:hypothetical protein
MINRQFTDNDFPDYDPLISGSNIVWRAPENSSSGTTELYFYKNSDKTTTRLTDNQGDDYPKISGNNVVWGNIDFHQEYGYPTSNSLYFFSSIDTIQLSNNFYSVHSEYRDNYFDISGTTVVWQQGPGWGEVERYDGTETSSLNIENADGVKIDGNNIAWRTPILWSPSGTRSSLHLYDGREISTIFATDDLPDEEENYYQIGNFQISGNNVAWHLTKREDFTNIIISSEIYLYDGSNNNQLTDNNLQEFGLQISGNNLVWTAVSDIIDYDDGQSGYTLYEGNDTAEIYFYDGINITQLTDNNVKDHSPQISGKNIVWQQGDGNEAEIFAFNGSRVIQVTDNNVPDENPQISGNNIVWQRTINGSSDFPSTEIFTTNIASTDIDEDEAYLYRFRNKSYSSGIYLFASVDEANAILANPNFSQTFELEGNSNPPFGDTPAFKVGVEPNDDLIVMNRFQNSNVPGTYLYAGEEESQNIRQNFPNFREEGIAFYVYPGDAGKGIDFYRFQNTLIPGTYIFVGEEERQNILANFPQFVEEGVAFEAFI